MELKSGKKGGKVRQGLQVKCGFHANCLSPTLGGWFPPCCFSLWFFSCPPFPPGQDRVLFLVLDRVLDLDQVLDLAQEGLAQDIFG